MKKEPRTRYIEFSDSRTGQKTLVRVRTHKTFPSEADSELCSALAQLRDEHPDNAETVIDKAMKLTFGKEASWEFIRPDWVVMF